MSERIFVKQRSPELIIFNHQRGMTRLNPEGEMVEDDPQFRRYINDGDLIVGLPPKPVKSEKPEIKESK